jgi:hypothetical protein
MMLPWKSLLGSYIPLTCLVAKDVFFCFENIPFDSYLLCLQLFWHLGRSHMSPQLFANPERFDPDWFEGLGPPPFTYMPFGCGPQICLGMEFAHTKMVVFLHHLVLNYEWSMVNPNEGVVWNPLPVFQKELPLKISKETVLGISL